MVSSSPIVDIYSGDALATLRVFPDNYIDAIVTDPPYGLAEHKTQDVTAALVAWCTGDREHVPDGRGFMGRDWDAFVPPPAVWDECLRVLKPGGHLLCFAGSRTVDLMGLSVRLAGFEIRDTITWHYGSGFPKSLDVSKAITATERHGGASSVKLRQLLMGEDYAPSGRMGNRDGNGRRPTGAEGREVELTENGERWRGYGTSLKPASEPILVARKPLAGTVTATVLAHGTGAMNIDGCRVAHGADVDLTRRQNQHADTAGMNGLGESGFKADHSQSLYAAGGRWPANVVLTHAPDCGPDEAPGPCVDGCPVAELDAQSGTSTSTQGKPRTGRKGDGWGTTATGTEYSDSGGASRFFPTFRYQAKAPTKERPKVDGVAHPTVKPLALMRWLVRLVCPPAGTVLDPFAGSGTTLQAARDEGFNSIGIEREPAYMRLIKTRLA